MDTASITGPQLVIDKDICLGNIQVMAEKAGKEGLILRPHFKTHQSLEVGRWFREYGVERITVSSLEMAYYFAADGWKDILVGIAYNPREYKYYESLSEDTGLLLTIAGPGSAEILARQCRSQMEVMIKIDTGYNRTGIRWDDDKSLRDCIKKLRVNKKIRIRGLMTHDGNTYALNKATDIKDRNKQTIQRLTACRDIAGIPDLVLSTGDTPSLSRAEDFQGINEIRPGNFIFYDLMQYVKGNCRLNDIAISMICPVIDIRPRSETVVIHGGAVHLSKESINASGKNIFGIVFRYDDKRTDAGNGVYLTSLSQEHGIIDCSASSFADDLNIGDLLTVLPVHSCLTADCMGGYLLTDGSSADHMRGRNQDSLLSGL